MARALLDRLGQIAGVDVDTAAKPVDPATVLHAVLHRRPDDSPDVIVEPLITREDSPTGLRYRNHEREGRTILLFTRLRADDRAFWFLGPARYRGHVGEKPMAITWELDVPLPGDLYAAIAAAVV